MSDFNISFSESKVQISGIQPSSASTLRLLFEVFNGSVLITKFNSIGGIVDRKLLPKEVSLSDAINHSFSEYGITHVTEIPYEEIKLLKRCPSCNSDSLELFYDNSVPVLPVYICKHCGAKSYYMTNEYLLNLINEHRELFDEDTLSKFEQDKPLFMNELKEYIARFFAAKKILRIQ
ncbi:MAG: hypothetical protein ACP5RP_00290 [Candidatus Micrarchaeia archaeon]